MNNALQPQRGFIDYTPAQSATMQLIDQLCEQLASSAGYKKIQLPLVESVDLFAHSIGDTSDIVGKEMFVLEQRNERQQLALRPEGTVGCLRTALHQDFVRNNINRVCYTGWMFRYERPQKGRYRQFRQFGAEQYGLDHYLADVELINLGNKILSNLNLSDRVRLKVNTLGSFSDRNSYRLKLQEWARDNSDKLDPDSIARIDSNPLRILDSKIASTKQLLLTAPALTEHLSDETNDRFSNVKELVSTSSSAPRIVEHDHNLVRGLDYYEHVVFEWVLDESEQNFALGGGGRYNSLANIIARKQMSAAGFALGIDRLLNLVPELLEQRPPQLIMVLADSETTLKEAYLYADKLRELAPKLNVELSLKLSSLKSQLKFANKRKASFSLIPVLEPDADLPHWVLRNMITGEQLLYSEQLSIDILAKFLDLKI